MGKKSLVYIEDNPGDVELFKNSISDYECQLTVLDDGKKALNFLTKEHLVSNQDIHLILIDLNLPIHDGFEILKHVKNNSKLLYIPTIVFSSSDAVEDINKSYRLGANGYLIKPMELEKYRTVISKAIEYWTKVNTSSILKDG